MKNPLNEASPSIITAPPAMKGGRSRKKYLGGGPPMYGSPVDGMVYEAPRAGYTYGGVSGSPPGAFAINQPYSSQASVSSACTKTGGRRRGRKGRKSRKNRNGRKSRKNRK